ncbi:NmrA family transcriptional regulator [Actinoplanes capillaceus]|uniref:NmrA family transcriptional regulator n=1 Tax=Actinoplanes campanulatus TaxID=113559 RepID=A0ABQ3WR68_9ACTN|nr:NmrA family NAD(P)-binding protein [Actinoplanes capillaceus]GID48671.1 NmrA family transcriptional regulator [Actinoplanes capillaceus]
MIVITTPTGDIGRQVLNRVLDSGEPVRVIVRDPSRLPGHVHDRAEVVQGSHSDADVIAKALAGADRLFWLVPPPPFGSPVSARQYYLDFARPAAEAAASQGAGMVGVTSLGHGYQGEAGLLSAALAMDALIEGAGAGYRALALPFFMENLLRHAVSIREQGTFSMANSADRPLPAVATRDVAATAATLLLDRSWRGPARVPVVSPDTLTPGEMAEVISETLGRTVTYRQVPVADLEALMRRRGASDAMTQGMADMIEAQNNGIYAAEPRDPGSAATGFRQWCQDVLRPAIES